MSEHYRQVYEQADTIYDLAQLQEAIAAMAGQLNQRLVDEEPLVVCVMNGGLVFSGLILPHFSFLMSLDYVHATRYGNKTVGTELTWLKQPSVDPKGRKVVILDDIFDEGFTLKSIVGKYQEMGASEVITAVLAVKEGTQKTDLRIDYQGVVVPNRYVFGFGMDYKGYFRNLPGIYAVKDS
ncbi:MAG: hypoxanthine-guanine phosphoribosyltransferase [Gammaproteobacteria bacterium]|nr:hypoxanthine-guanine phosphoribosyltransferase [Gammaproteobacteria bacterium]